MKTCRFEGCDRAPIYAGQAFCEDHRLRWVPSKPGERKPAWVERLAANAKDFTNSGRAA